MDMNIATEDEARQYLRSIGMRIEEGACREIVLGLLAGKSKYWLNERPFPVASENTVKRIALLLNGGQLDPYVGWLVRHG